MNDLQLPQPLTGKKIYFVGIKGTGMAALAELFLNAGALVSGSDTDEVFYTDAILKQLGIKYREGFSSTNLEDDYDLVIHSSAYSRDSNPDLEESYKRNIPVMEYTKALGAWSRTAPSCGIAGVHGKTTTTGITGTILKEMGLPVSVLAGSAISNFDGKSTFTAGDKYFVAETCEYKRHFLSFSPDILLVTSIEPDHLDYFKDYDDIFSAFLSYADKLPDGGILIYCSDEKGAASLGKAVGEKNKRIKLIPYGISADGDFKVKNIKQLDGKTMFNLQGIESDFELRVPGLHNVLNSAAAAAVSACVASFINRKKISDDLKADGKKIASGVRNFKGSKRRSELLGEACGIVFM
ncbi:MAG: Mur ligase family protein, partial [Spirochaetia bacterium]|nr:Mur ligase family protein [Spirochaetia bacterium]